MVRPRFFTPVELDTLLDDFQYLDTEDPRGWIIPALVMPGEEEGKELAEMRERVLKVWLAAPQVTAIGYSFGIHSSLNYDRIWLETFIEAFRINKKAPIHVLSPDAAGLRDELAAALKRTVNVHAWPLNWHILSLALMAIRYSGHTLIPHLQNLFLHQKALNEDQFRTLFYDLELLPYTLGLCWHAVIELARIQDEFSKAFADEAFKDATIHGLGDEARDRMTYAIDAFLDAARRSQNAVIYYIRRHLGKQLPLSMNKLVKGIRAGSIQLPEGLQAGILKYWDEHGLRLKQYRDLA